MGFFSKKLDTLALNHFNEKFADLKDLHMGCQIVVAEKLEDRLKKLKEDIKSSNGDGGTVFKNEALNADRQIKFYENILDKKESWLNVCNLVEATVAEAYCHCMRADDVNIILNVHTEIENYIAEVKAQKFLYEPSIKKILVG